MVWRYSESADNLLIHNMNKKLIIELSNYSYFRFRFTLPNASSRVCWSSKFVLTEPNTLSAGSNGDELKAGLSWGIWSVRHHGMLLSIENGMQKLVLTDDGFVVSDIYGALVVKDGVEKDLSSPDRDKYLDQAQATVEIANANSKRPKVCFKTCIWLPAKPSESPDSVTPQLHNMHEPPKLT